MGRRPPPLVDPIGPFPPRLVYAAILLLDFAAIGAVLLTVLVGADWIEDIVTPGGIEWLPF